MKKNNKKFFGLFVLLMFCSLAFFGCFGSVNIDGVRLSSVKYDMNYRETINDTKMYNLVFSCEVKNTTSDTLQFEIVYSARISGIFGSTSKQSQDITLAPNETRRLTYTMERVQQALDKDIEIFNVQVV